MDYFLMVQKISQPMILSLSFRKNRNMLNVIFTVSYYVGKYASVQNINFNVTDICHQTTD